MDNERYLNQTCPVCGKNFSENDDVVVCPICGTPHHRTCYTNNGNCYNANLHQSGFVWAPVVVPPTPDASINNQEPPQFNNTNWGQPPVSPYASPVAPPNAPKGFGANFPEEIEPGVSTVDAAAYVNKSAPHYLSKFFVDFGKKHTFNFWAFLFGGYWFMYRKMYKLGLIFLVIPFLVSSIASFVPACVNAEKAMTSFEVNIDNLEASIDLQDAADDLKELTPAETTAETTTEESTSAPLISVNVTEENAESAEKAESETILDTTAPESTEKVESTTKSLSAEEQLENYLNEFVDTVKDNRTGLFIVSVISLLDFGFHIYLGFTANRYYKKHVISSLKEISNEPIDENVRRMKILHDGGVSFLAFFGSVLAISMLTNMINSLSTMIFR